MYSLQMYSPHMGLVPSPYKRQSQPRPTNARIIDKARQPEKWINDNFEALTVRKSIIINL